MNSLSLKLYPDQFGVLMLFLQKSSKGLDQMPLRYRPLSGQVLSDYLVKWTPLRKLTWRNRCSDRAYPLRLPITVALALYGELQHNLLTSAEHLLLGVLDQAVVDYRLLRIAD